MPICTVESPDGFKFFCQSPAEAAALWRTMREAYGTLDAPPRGPGRPTKGEISVREQAALADLKAASDFMEAVIDRAEQGADADAIVRALKLAGTRGVGGATVTVRRVLKEIGFDIFDDVVKKEKTIHGTIWKAGSKAKDAFAALQKAEAEAEAKCAK
jgi:hypothetical protein